MKVGTAGSAAASVVNSCTAVRVTPPLSFVTTAYQPYLVLGVSPFQVKETSPDPAAVPISVALSTLALIADVVRLFFRSSALFVNGTSSSTMSWLVYCVPAAYELCFAVS